MRVSHVLLGEGMSVRMLYGPQMSDLIAFLASGLLF